jgi:hypothetical protein
MIGIADGLDDDLVDVNFCTAELVDMRVVVIDEANTAGLVMVVGSTMRDKVDEASGAISSVAAPVKPAVLGRKALLSKMGRDRTWRAYGVLGTVASAISCQERRKRILPRLPGIRERSKKKQSLSAGDKK